MSEYPTPTLTRPARILRWLVGSALLALLVAVVEARVGWGVVLAAWRGVPPRLLLLAALLFAASHALRALRIHRFIAQRRGMTFTATLKLSLIHQWFNNLLPMRLGELAYPALLKRYGRSSLVEGVTSLLWLRLIDALVMGTVAVALIGLLLPGVPVAATLAVTVIVLLAALVLFTNRGLTALLDQHASSNLVRVAARLLGAAPDSVALRWELVGWTVAAWLVKLVALVLIATSLAQVTPLAAMSGVLAGEASTLLPVHGIAGAGSYEAAFVAAVVPLGMSADALLPIAVNTHLFTLAATSLLAALVLPFRVAPATAIQEEPTA